MQKLISNLAARTKSSYWPVEQIHLANHRISVHNMQVLFKTMIYNGAL